jgi:endoglucanase
MYKYGSSTSWWGANQQGIVDHPISLNVANRIVYEVHDYGPNVWNQPWHNDPNFPNNLPGFWDTQWGFVHNNNIGPIWIGEWGSKLDITKEVQWATTLRDYISSKHLSWTWWTFGPNSGDTGGILQDDWTHTQSAKLSLVNPVQYPVFAPSSGTGAPPAPPPPSGSGEGSGGGSGGCGLTGLEAAVLLALLAARRRRPQSYS